MQKTILITGATSGIGLELSEQYAELGHRVILVGRKDLPTLDPHLFSEENYCQIDLTQKNSAQVIAEFLRQKEITALDLLVLNAGIGWWGSLTSCPVKTATDMTKLNLIAPIRLTHQLLPLLESSAGKIIFVSSVTANLPCKNFAVYAATKAAVAGFSRSLRIELQNKVQVLLFEPGGTLTEMHKKALVPDELVSHQKFHTASEVAASLIAAEQQNRKLKTVGLNNSLLSFAGRKFPGLFAAFAR